MSARNVLLAVRIRKLRHGLRLHFTGLVVTVSSVRQLVFLMPRISLYLCEELCAKQVDLAQELFQRTLVKS